MKETITRISMIVAKNLCLAMSALWLGIPAPHALAGGPTPLPVRADSIDLAIWHGTPVNDGVTGGPTLEIAHAANVDGTWMRSPESTNIGYRRCIIDLDPEFINPGGYGNVYIGINNAVESFPWRGEIYHFDGSTIRLRQETAGNHPDVNNLFADAKDDSLQRPGTIVAPRFANQWPETGNGLRSGGILWQGFTTTHGWYYDTSSVGTIVDNGGVFSNYHYIGFYQDVDLWGEFGSSTMYNSSYDRDTGEPLPVAQIDIDPMFRDMDEVLIVFWGAERHWFGYHNGVYYGRVRWDNGNVSNVATGFNSAYTVSSTDRDFSEIRCRAWHDATGRPMLESGRPDAGTGPGCSF